MKHPIRLDKSVNEKISLGNGTDVQLYLKREDQIHPQISGNKYRKLKYNLEEARKQEMLTLLTFGGAYSNHIAAVAAVGKEFGFNTIGVIRGEELETKIQDNNTLSFANECGMTLHFVTRAAYRDRSSEEFLSQLKQHYGECYIIPEGGTNDLAIKGCEEILTEEDADFDYICCSVGTGGTIAGLINSCSLDQRVLGFPALKGDFLQEDIRRFATNERWDLISDYHFGGYAKINAELVTFINQFKRMNGVQLDPVYTAKMMYGIADLIHNGYFPKDSRILAIHTGGLQGIPGVNRILKKKQLSLIE
jgi:1-aminocyclopropane-1-carboxylate deaminase